MNCPYCNFELTFGDQTVSGKQVAVCRNPECKYAGWHLPAEIFDELNAGKCAKHNLSVVREQFDRGYNAWIHSDNDLRQKLKQAQDALEIATNKLEAMAHNVWAYKRPTVLTVARIAEETLKKIATITKQGE